MKERQRLKIQRGSEGTNRTKDESKVAGNIWIMHCSFIGSVHVNKLVVAGV